LPQTYRNSQSPDTQAPAPRVFQLNHRAIEQAFALDRFFSYLIFRLARFAGHSLLKNAHFALALI
jgi:hypothetical protein